MLITIILYIIIIIYCTILTIVGAQDRNRRYAWNTNLDQGESELNVLNILRCGADLLGTYV